MGRPSLASLFVVPTQAQIKQTLLQLIAAAGFPVSSWGPLSAGRGFVEADSQVDADWAALITNIAYLGFPSRSAGDLLKVGASEIYAYDYAEATTTQGNIALQDGGAGPFTITLGQLRIQLANGLYYVNTIDDGLYPRTLPLNGSVVVPFQAEIAGSDANAPDGTTVSMVTVLAGVTASTSSSSGTWITTPGTDDEPDTSIAANALGQWSRLAVLGGPPDIFQAWALAAAPGLVTHVQTLEGVPNTWDLTMWLGGPAGPVSAAVVAAVQDYVDPGVLALPLSTLPTLQQRRPFNTSLLVQSAAPFGVPAIGSVYAPKSKLAGVQAAALQNITALQATIAIGATVYVDAVRDAIMNAGARNCPLTSTDVQVPNGSIGVFDVSQLSFVGF